LSRDESFMRCIHESLEEKENTISNANANEETRIRAVIDDWARAIRTKDATAVVSQYATDNVKFILAPPLQYRWPSL